MDGQNWFAIPFTVKYHLEVGRMYYGTHPTSLEEPTDLWWHLVFEEEVEFEYLAFHTSNAASQDDAAYELCFPMDHNYMYVTNTLPSAPGTEEPITEAPATDTPVETEAPATDAPATDAPTADGSETDAVTETPATTEGAADSEGTPVWIWIVIGVAVVAVVVVVVILGKKKK
jgi:cobalamin biosynthesis Mg chelatase CobN